MALRSAQPRPGSTSDCLPVTSPRPQPPFTDRQPAPPALLHQPPSPSQSHAPCSPSGGAPRRVRPCARRPVPRAHPHAACPCKHLACASACCPHGRWASDTDTIDLVEIGGFSVFPSYPAAGLAGIPARPTESFSIPNHGWDHALRPRSTDFPYYSVCLQILRRV